MEKLKSLVIIILLSFFLLPSDALAIETLSVSFKTSFSENIDIDNLGSILIMMDDASPKSYDLELNSENNFSYELSGLINGEIKINSLFVARDFSGKYDLSYERKNISANEIEITVNVRLNTPKENTTTAKVNDAIFADIFGQKYVDQITEPIESAGTEDGYDEKHTVDMNTNNSNNSTTNNNIIGGSTTNSYGQTDSDLIEQSKKIEEQRKELEKEEAIEKRNNLYTIILIVVILILIVVIIFVAIKFANANK